MIAIENSASSALVAKTSRPGADERYLVVTPLGRTEWVDDPASATAFPSLREATRAAMRLPSNLRAFSLPRDLELALTTAH